MIARPRLAWTALAVWLALDAVSAAAAERWVSPTGNAGTSGTSAAAAWSLAAANAALRPGDVCRLLPGVYAGEIAPAASGAAGRRITFLGEPRRPEAVSVAGITLKGEYVVVRGVRARNGASIEFPARHNTIVECALGGLYLGAAKHCRFERNRIQQGIQIVANGGRSCFEGARTDPGCFANSEFDTLFQNDIDLGLMGPGARAFVIRGFTRRCLFERNRVYGVFDNGNSSNEDAGGALVIYNASDLVFRRNRWELEARSAHNSPNQMWDAIVLRDSTRGLRFERDTMLLGLHGRHEIRGLLAASGNFPQSVADNHWVECFYKANGYFYTQDRFERCSIERSVFASGTGNALWISGTAAEIRLDHSVFYSTGQAVRFDDRFEGRPSVLSSNLFYSERAAPPGNDGGVVKFGERSLENVRSDYNVFYTPTRTFPPGNRSIVWCCFEGSRPGSFLSWNRKTRNDAHSRFGDPRLVSPSFASLDVRLRERSVAIGAGQGGSNAGPTVTAPPPHAPRR